MPLPVHKLLELVPLQLYPVLPPSSLCLQCLPLSLPFLTPATFSVLSFPVQTPALRMMVVLLCHLNSQE